MKNTTRFPNAARANSHRGPGTILNALAKFSWYWLFVFVLAVADFALIFFSLQELDGEQIANGAIIPLVFCLAITMALSGHFAGIALRQRAKKEAIFSFALGFFQWFVVAYIRLRSEGDLALLCFNISFFLLMAYVSYLRARHQRFFQIEAMIEKLNQAIISLTKDNEYIKLEIFRLEQRRQQKISGFADTEYKRQVDELETKISQLETWIANLDLFVETRMTQIQGAYHRALASLNRYR